MYQNHNKSVVFGTKIHNFELINRYTLTGGNSLWIWCGGLGLAFDVRTLLARSVLGAAVLSQAQVLK